MEVKTFNSHKNKRQYFKNSRYIKDLQFPGVPSPLRPISQQKSTINLRQLDGTFTGTATVNLHKKWLRT